jgi:hypothetical protein
MRLFHRLERALGRYALPNLALYLIGGQVLFFSLSLLTPFDVRRIMLWPALVMQGDWWRLFTFVLVPPTYGPLTMTAALFLAISWYFFYMISQALESHWGVFRFNGFFLLGWVLTVGVGFLTPEYPVSYGFFAVSVFLAFAFLNPDFELYVFFILPVKIKWFALFMWLSFGFEFVTGDWNIRLAVLAATGNYLVFFAGDIVQRIRTGRQHMRQQVRRAAFRQEEGEPRHRCVVCGKTDLSDPQMDFRYCSKCANDECYCADHIFNHEHTVAPAAKP